MPDAKWDRRGPAETVTLRLCVFLRRTSRSCALERRYVSRSQTGPLRLRYLKIMGINALRDGEPRRSLLMQSLAEDARQITDDELDLLLTSEWRSRLTAAWLIGLDHRTQFRDRIGSLLRDGALMKAGAGYVFALARFGQHPDAVLLARALGRRLSTPEPFYEQHFVTGALLYLDEQLGTDHARDMLGRSFSPYLASRSGNGSRAT
jgi:hypothetical protein